MTHLPAEPRPYAAPYGATAQRPAGRRSPPACEPSVEERLGRRVAEAVTQGGGFTNGFASRLLLADGSRVFVKAVSGLGSPEVFSSYQQEILVAGAMPEPVPVTKLRWVLEQEDWLMLAFDDVAGRTRSGLGSPRNYALSWTC